MTPLSDLERGVEVFAAVNFWIVGLSHLLRPRAWSKFFADLGALGTTGAFVNGMLSLAMGSVIVALHNVWSWPGVVLTSIGWLYLVKAAVAFAAPETALRSMALASPDRAGRFRMAGALMIGLGSLLLYSALEAFLR